MGKAIKILLFLVVVLALAAGGFVYYLLKTTDGLRMAADLAVERFVQAETKTIASMEGTLSSTAVLKNVELKDLRGLPAGSLVRVQELVITPHGLNYKNADITLRNARVKLPVSENIVIDGTAKDRALSFTIFSPMVDVAEVLHMAARQKVSLRKWEGGVSGIDLRVSGTVSEPAVVGIFKIDTLSKPDLVLKESPGTLNLALSGRRRNLKIKGEIALEKGSLKARKAKIELKPSKVYFSGDPKDPALAIEGYSRVQTVDIDLLVKGTAKKPDLNLTSDPPLTKEELMMTLATGRKFELESLEGPEASSALARDFVGYLFFSGSGEGFFDKMGITDIKVTMEGDRKGVGFKKEVSDHVDVGYEVEQKGGAGGQQNVSQILGADYRVTNAFFASVERQLQVLDGANADQPGNQDNRLLMKYKTRF
jgi:hypothetical protein